MGKDITCISFLVGVICFIYKPSIAQQSAVRPNIILIIGDDISRDDIGVYGKNPFIHTPNIDAMAHVGFRFDHFFVTSSSCSPSRTSLLTGRYPHNSGAAELHSPLPASQNYFPELLKDSGYFTALLGKWHEGENTRRAYDTLITGVPVNGDGGENQWVNVLQTRPKDKPFFLWLASFDAHRDWDDNQQFHHSPDSVFIPATLVDTKETRKDLAAYYGEIERLDFYVGRLKEELVKRQIWDNTIVVFVGDNGRPFPGDKTRLYDRGTNTPLVIKPAHSLEKGKIISALISGIDMAPTILSLANVPIVPSIQGRSFVPLLNGYTDTFRNYIFTEHDWHDYKAYERAVRTKDFLYIENKLWQLPNQGPLDAVNSPSFASLLVAKGIGRLNKVQQDVFIAPRAAAELYNLSIDALNQYSLIGDKHYKKVAQRLKDILHQWQRETKDDFPRDLTPDWYGRLHGETLPQKGKRGAMPGKKSGAQQTDNKGPF